MKIDSHCHYIPEKVARQTSFYKQGWSDIEGLNEFLRVHELDRAIVVYPTTDAHISMGWDQLCTIYNREIAEIKNKYKERFLVTGIVPMQPTPEGLTYHLKAIERYGFEGISIASSCEGRFLDDPYFHELYDFCQKKKVFLFVHPQTSNPIGYERVKDPLLMPVIEYVFDLTMSCGKLMMEGVFDRYPTVRFIFSHFGGVLPFLKDRFDTVYHMLRGRNLVKELPHAPSLYLKNIYVDTSGTRSSSILTVGLEVFGPERILWGSDFPVAKSNKDPFEILEGCDEDIRVLITGANWKRILRK